MTPKQAARASWIAALAGLLVTVLDKAPSYDPQRSLLVGLLFLSGLAAAIYALSQVRHVGKSNLLVPALFGLLSNIVAFGIVVAFSPFLG